MSHALPSFVRAMSPLANAMADLSNDADARTITRHTLLQGASTMEELLALISDDYRHVLRGPLKGISDTTEKLLKTRATLAKWRQHQAAGTTPTHMRAKAPQVQLTKDFGMEPADVAHQAALLAVHSKYMQEALSESIRAKEEEANFLDMALKPHALYNELAPLVENRLKEILARSQLPVFETDLVTGELALTGWRPNESAQALARDVRSDCVVYAFRVISMTESHEMMAEAKINKKKAIAAHADIEMADATRAGPSLQSMIDKAVSAAFKKGKNPGNAKAKKDGKSRSPSTRPPFRATDTPKHYIPKPGRKPPSAINRGKGKPQGKGKGKAKA
ncbi:hypothetical protein B0H10DRAFT_2441864 [Mycena sp. CBHHK59/15]|nr:hypothetical protein B0H10DRAFT_2441864 [Mycena sp. CBHHK59/15]